LFFSLTGISELEPSIEALYTQDYTQFFGTRDQPNKPARTTVQVVLPAGVRGALVEIDLIAVRPK
jgi:enamine deaminase RidA (YjgF/YER057c/UK114 family)